MKKFLRPACAMALVIGFGACDDGPAPPFEVQGTGSVEGFVFFDADRDGRFDAAAGDTILRNVGVTLLERGTSRTIAGGTGQTDATGRFLITGVHPGTHDLLIDTTTASGLRFCQNPVPVTVYISERQFRQVPGRAACIISIAEAEQMVGQTVVVQGIITSAPGQLRSQYTYIEDESGGIRIFSAVPEGRGLEIGDRIEVTGRISVFNQDLQIGNPLSIGAVQKNAFQVVPQRITTQQLAQAGQQSDNPLLGVLVEIRGAQITTAFGAEGVAAQNAWIDSGDGRAQIRFEGGVVSNADQLNTLFPVGKCYNITGVTGTFRGDGQIFPRTLADVQEVQCQ